MVGSYILVPAGSPGLQISSCNLQSAPCSPGQAFLSDHQTVSENLLRVSDKGLRGKPQGNSWIGCGIQGPVTQPRNAMIGSLRKLGSSATSVNGKVVLADTTCGISDPLGLNF
jgi:hypothetical protein